MKRFVAAAVALLLVAGCHKGAADGTATQAAADPSAPAGGWLARVT